MGPGSPMRISPPPRSRFAGGQSLRSGAWLSRVWITVQPCWRARVDQRRDGRHDGFEQRDIVAEGMAESA